MKNQKEKIIKIYKDMLNDKESKLDSLFRFEVIYLGTTTLVYVKDFYKDRINPPITTLRQVRIRRKKKGDIISSEVMTLGFELNPTKTETRFEKKTITYKTFFGLLTSKKVVEYRYEDSIESAEFFIAYGAIKETISQKEYFELLNLAKKEEYKRINIHKKELQQKLDEQMVVDQERLDKMD